MHLGLDLGTSNVKAVLLDADNRVMNDASVAISRRTLADGGVEQDFDEIWRAVTQVIRAVARPEVRSVGVSSQGAALLLIDPQARPLGPIVSWIDTRGEPFNHDLTQTLGEEHFRQRLGCGRARLLPGQWLRLQHQMPEITQSAHVSCIGDLVVQRLCGCRALDHTMLSIAGLVDQHERTYDACILRALQLSADRLPRIVPPTQPAGLLTLQASRMLDLPAGIPVTPAVHDQYAAALAVGAIHPGDLLFASGTAWVLMAITDGYVAPVDSEAFVSGHVVPGIFGHLLPLPVGVGGAAVQWAARLTGADGMVESLIASAPRGAAGLRYIPPIDNQPGRLEGLHHGLGPAHVLRAVLEGLAMELRRAIRRLDHLASKSRPLLVTGPVAASEPSAGIIADLVGQPLRCFASDAGSARGAALLGRALVESADTLQELAARTQSDGRIIHPSAEAPDYRRMFQQKEITP